MSTKRVRLISLTGIILIALIIGASVLINYLSKDTQEVPLPDISATAGTPDTTSATASRGPELVTITKDNVQDVIATLERPSSYSRTLQIERMYKGDSTITTIAVYFDRGATSLKISEESKNIVIAGDKLYIWYNGEKKPYVRPLDTAEDEKKSSDEYQMIKSYEDVLGLDKSSITAAEYVDYKGENCIYVQCYTDRLHYTDKYYISVNTGLLSGAETYDGDTQIYEMSSTGYDPSEPPASVFNLPDGTSPL